MSIMILLPDWIEKRIKSSDQHTRTHTQQLPMLKWCIRSTWAFDTYNTWYTHCIFDTVKRDHTVEICFRTLCNIFLICWCAFLFVFSLKMWLVDVYHIYPRKKIMIFPYVIISNCPYHFIPIAVELWWVVHSTKNTHAMYLLSLFISIGFEWKIVLRFIWTIDAMPQHAKTT